MDVVILVSIFNFVFMDLVDEQTLVKTMDDKLIYIRNDDKQNY